MIHLRGGLKFHSRYTLAKAGIEVSYHLVQRQVGHVRDEQPFHDVNCLPTYMYICVCVHIRTHNERMYKSTEGEVKQEGI